jgi:hypothetical protein
MIEKKWANSGRGRGREDEREGWHEGGRGRKKTKLERRKG